MSNKTSDKNVANVTKSDIDILNALIYVYEARLPNYNELMDSEVKSLKNILSDYTRQQQINEEHQKINGELREQVKELEEERQLVGMLVKNKRDGRIGIVLHQWENGSVAVLESINPRVINTHDSWNTLEIITDEVKQVQTNSDSISKQKIKNEFEKIQLLYEKNLKEVDLKELQKIDKKIFEGIRLEAQRDLARELLQESEDK